MALRRPQLSLSVAFAVLLIVLGFGVLVSAAGSSASTTSPDVELICHTDNPSECYPKVFQATDEFQIVREDQDLPPGLHVRLNVWTGVKEAKINDPTDETPELSGLPVDSSVVLVEPEPATEPEKLLPKGAPVYENVGKIKTPVDESSSFYESLDALKQSVGQKAVAQARFLESIETLKELSHDIYYGLQLTKDIEAVKALFCLIGGNSVKTTEDNGDESWSFAVREAASILSAAIQNNPTALDEIAKAWPTISKFKCTPGEDGGATVEEHLPRTLATLAVGGDHEAARVKATVSAINGLLKSSAIRESLLSNGLMSGLLHVLAPRGGSSGDGVGDGWETAQARVGQLVMDNFLDEGMGAVLGVWPTFTRSRDHDECTRLLDDAAKVKDGSTRTLSDADGCWDYHVSEIARRFDGEEGHWSAEFLRLLRLQRPLGGNGGGGKGVRVVDEL